MSFRTRLAIAIVSIVVLIGVFISWVSYEHGRDIIINNAIKRVSTVSRSREDLLLQLLRFKQSRLANTLELITNICSSGKPAIDKACANRYVEGQLALSQAEGLKFSNSHLTITAGDMKIFPEWEVRNSRQLAVFGNFNGKTFYAMKVSNAKNVYLKAIFDAQDINKIFEVNQILGISGETFLADKNGLFLTPPKYQSQAGHSHPIEARPMKMCLSGSDGEVLDPDYRGVPVIHGYRYLEEIDGACIMAHIDQKEAFAPAQDLLAKMFLIILILLVVSAIVAYFLSLYFTRPLHILEAKSRALGQGQLDVDIPQFKSSELNTFAATFRSMARSLQNYLTERKRVEEKLLEREQALAIERTKLHSLLLEAPAIFSLTIGPDHVFEIFNKEARKTIGGRDCTGLPIRKALPELEGKGFFEALDQVYATGEPLYLTEAPAELIQTDGSVKIHYFNVVYHPWRDTRGVIEGIMNVSVDVTEQVLARKRVELAELELRTLANTMPQLAFMANADGFIYWYNDNWYNYTGKTLKDIEGWGWQQVHDPGLLPKVLEKWKASVDTGELFEMEFPLKGADGKFRWFLTRVSPFRDPSGKVVKWFGTSTDIDDQRQIRESLKETLRARDEFLSIASHELKTPLTSLTLHTQMLERQIKKYGLESLQLEKFDHFIGQVSRQNSRMGRLIDDMLDIGRIRSGKLTIHKEEIDVCGLITETIERLSPMLEESGTIPHLENCGPAVGFFDKSRIEQAVNNLLTNAMRYGNHKPISISLLNQGDKVLLKIQDQGIGISKDAQTRIFDRFERAVNANEISGMGLGLFITKEIIEAHGGRIWVHSEGIGHGSTFYIELPLDVPAKRPPDHYC